MNTINDQLQVLANVPIMCDWDELPAANAKIAIVERSREGAISLATNDKEREDARALRGEHYRLAEKEVLAAFAKSRSNLKEGTLSDGFFNFERLRDAKTVVRGGLQAIRRRVLRDGLGLVEAARLVRKQLAAHGNTSQ